MVYLIETLMYTYRTRQFIHRLIPIPCITLLVDKHTYIHTHTQTDRQTHSHPHFNFDWRSWTVSSSNGLVKTAKSLNYRTLNINFYQNPSSQLRRLHIWKQVHRLKNQRFMSNQPILGELIHVLGDHKLRVWQSDLPLTSCRRSQICKRYVPSRNGPKGQAGG